MTIFTFANNINTTLAGAVSPSATTITLASTANLPASIPAGEVLVITLNDVATRQNFEIVYATARTGATLTVLRAQEGTAALAWLTGDFAYSPPTAGQMQNCTQVSQFPSSLTVNGYKKYPDPNSPSGYFIEQWGGGSVTSSGTGVSLGVFNLPIAFPNGFLQPTAGYAGTAPNAILGAITASQTNLSQVNVYTYTSGAGVPAIWWKAIGY